MIYKYGVVASHYPLARNNTKSRHSCMRLAGIYVQRRSPIKDFGNDDLTQSSVGTSFICVSAKIRECIVLQNELDNKTCLSLLKRDSVS